MFAVVLFTVGILLILSKFETGWVLGAGGGCRERPWPVPTLPTLTVFLSPCRQELQVQFQPEAQVSGGRICLGEPLCPVLSSPRAPWLRSLGIPFRCLVPKVEGCSAAGLLGGTAPRAPSSACPCALGHPTPGVGCWSHPLSPCTSSCRAPGDEEAQAENLITSNGKVTCPMLCVLCRCFWVAPACLPSIQLWAGTATPLPFPLQRREHRKRRTEREPCGESRGCRGPAQASVSGGTRAVTASVLGRKGGVAGAACGGATPGLPVDQSAGTGRLCIPSTVQERALAEKHAVLARCRVSHARPAPLSPAGKGSICPDFPLHCVSFPCAPPPRSGFIFRASRELSVSSPGLLACSQSCPKLLGCWEPGNRWSPCWGERGLCCWWTSPAQGKAAALLPA